MYCREEQIDAPCVRKSHLISKLRFVLKKTNPLDLYVAESRVKAAQSAYMNQREAKNPLNLEYRSNVPVPGLFEWDKEGRCAHSICLKQRGARCPLNLSKTDRRSHPLKLCATKRSDVPAQTLCNREGAINPAQSVLTERSKWLTRSECKREKR